MLKTGTIVKIKKANEIIITTSHKPYIDKELEVICTIKNPHNGVNTVIVVYDGSVFGIYDEALEVVKC